MFYANDEAGRRQYILESVPKVKYYCPYCGGEVVRKMGNLKVNHFAHKNLADCDATENKMTDWLLGWQKNFADDEREVIIKDERTGKKHIADVKLDGIEIEFQHSPMDVETFAERCA